MNALANTAKQDSIFTKFAREHIQRNAMGNFATMKDDPSLKLVHIGMLDSWELFHTSFKAATTKQNYNCSCCRAFIRNYADLGILYPDGVVIPLLWSHRTIGANELHKAERRFFNKFEDARVVGPAILDETDMGISESGGFNHFHVPVPRHMQYNSRTNKLTAGQKVAELVEEHRMVSEVAAKYSNRVVDQGIEYLQTNLLNNSAPFIERAKWFAEFKKQIETDTTLAHNIAWSMVLNASAGFTHVASGMLGSLFDMVSDGKSFDQISRSWNAQVSPEVYRRPQELPKEQTLVRASETFERMGLDASLPRQFATLKDFEKIPELVVWSSPSSIDSPIKSGVFSSVKTRSKKIDTRSKVQVASTSTTMTLSVFMRDVLPSVTSMEYVVPEILIRSFYVFTRQVNEEAPPLIKWDSEKKRNTLGWYTYTKGIDNEHFGYEYPETVPIKALVKFPNMVEDHGFGSIQGYVFLVERGTEEIDESCLFPELIRSDLHEFRSVVEAYSKSTPITPVNKSEQPAMGPAFRLGQTGIKHEFVIRRKGVEQRIIIDRVE